MNEYTILIARVGVVGRRIENVPMLDTVARLFIIYSLSTNDLPLLISLRVLVKERVLTRH